MATIEKRKSGDKYVYRARVRVKGAVPRTATFPSKTLAKAWAQKLEVQIKENQYLPTMQSQNHTLNDVIAEYKTRAKDSKRPISETTQIQLNVWDELIVYALTDKHFPLVLQLKRHKLFLRWCENSHFLKSSGSK